MRSIIINIKPMAEILSAIAQTIFGTTRRFFLKKRSLNIKLGLMRGMRAHQLQKRGFQLWEGYGGGFKDITFVLFQVTMQTKQHPEGVHTNLAVGARPSAGAVAYATTA